MALQERTPRFSRRHRLGAISEHKLGNVIVSIRDRLIAAAREKPSSLESKRHRVGSLNQMSIRRRKAAPKPKSLADGIIEVSA
ncbi:MAG TPA: hypothetical protein VMA83_12460 [Solirubrobacteraceae bacterium]|nr:hypothetical protein [Solirubrobacteraceae bacterium]